LRDRHSFLDKNQEKELGSIGQNDFGGMIMVTEETMMFQFGTEENKAARIIREVCAAMEDKGYNPINQLVGYLLSGDPAYITSHGDARNKIRMLERDELLEELVRSYLEGHKKADERKDS
jgi:uncharacterized protein (UPF0297 family)